MGRDFFTSFFPQGWAFFTKPSDDPEYHPYSVGLESKLDSLSKFPNSDDENLFGISRAQRSQGPELASLANGAAEWVDCSGIEIGLDCFDVALNTINPVIVINKFPEPTLCGKLLISQTVPVPWAYRDSYQGWRVDEQVTVLEVQCS